MYLTPVQDAKSFLKPSLLRVQSLILLQVINKYNSGCDNPRITWLDHGTEHPHRIALSVKVDIVGAVARELENEIGRSSKGLLGMKVSRDGRVLGVGAIGTSGWVE